jgi:transposase
MGAAEGKASHGIGKTRGGWGTKIHTVVDALGFPIDIIVTEGQVNDNIPALDLLKDKESKNVLADAAFDTDAIRALIKKQGKQAVIPNQARRSQKLDYDKHIYKERHLVECFFQRIKNLRRIATRYEKNVTMYRGMVLIACVLIWLMF